MKNTLIILLAGAALALGGLCMLQSRKGSEHQAQIGSLRADVEQKSAEIENLQATQNRADRQRRELMGPAEVLAAPTN